MLAPEPIQVFISYKSEDRLFAETLRTNLRAWGYHTWLDVDNIPGGIGQGSPGWMKALHQGVKTSQAMVGLLATESLDSEFVLAEWQSARDNNLRFFLLKIRDVAAGDIPMPFNLVQYYDVIQDPEVGFNLLKSELDTFAANHHKFQQAYNLQPASSIAPTTTDTVSQQAPTPKHRQGLFRRGDQLIGSRDAVKDRMQMLDRVHDYWIKGVLYPTLRDLKYLKIGIGTRPDAVLRHKDYGNHPLNDSGDILKAFEALEGSLLILGDPGAGKTVLLLQLAEMLINSAKNDTRKPIPIVLNLSSWGFSQKSLHEWLISETSRTYRVRANTVKTWLDDNRLLLLLDGLDEVKEGVRARCVENINAFRREYDRTRTVVCSRVKDYEDLPERLDLKGAVVLSALTESQVDDYLSDPALASLREVITEDETLREMATTPFLLNTMVYAYADQPAAALRGYSIPAERRKHLFDTYLEKRLTENPTPWGYKKSRQYLEWLATKMQAYVQTVFRFEDIRPYWLNEEEREQALGHVTRFQILYVLPMMILIALGFSSKDLRIFISVLILLPVVVVVSRGVRIKRDVLSGDISPKSMFKDIGRGDRLIQKVVLWRNGRLPWRWRFFFNTMTSLQIMRRVGDGYIFIHRYLLESLANRDEIIILFSRLADFSHTQQHALGALARIANLDTQDTPKAPDVIAKILEKTHLHQIDYDSILRHGELEFRRGAAFALRYIENGSVEPVIAALNDKDRVVRRSAALALPRIGKKLDVEELIPFLFHRDPDVRFYTARTLGEIQDIRAVEPLIRALKDRRHFVRGKAAYALGEIQDKRAVEPLINALRDWRIDVKRAAIISLGSIGDKRATDVLISILKGRNRQLRLEAIEALGLIGEVRAVEPLIALLQDKDAEIKVRAIQALGMIGDNSAVIPLIKALGEDDPVVRINAAHALGQIRDNRAIQPLIAALQDANHRVVADAAFALGEFDDEQAIKPLQFLLDSDSARVKFIAAATLVKLGNLELLPLLLEGLEHESAYLRYQIAYRLGEIGDESAVAALIDVLNDEEQYVRLTAAASLTKIGTAEALAAVEAWRQRETVEEL